MKNVRVGRRWSSGEGAALDIASTKVSKMLRTFSCQISDGFFGLGELDVSTEIMDTC